ncbi:MAG: hypothetical protein ACF8Q5_11800 [Phycisphaerales bacterium JB040]
MPRTAPLATAVLAAALGAATLSGCAAHREGGSGFSNDTFTYVSTTYEPKTLTLIDTRDGEPVWAVDVPVGMMLTVQFKQNAAKRSSPETPDVMIWGLGKSSRNSVSLSNRITVPPADARRLDMSLRDAPEWPQANAGN